MRALEHSCKVTLVEISWCVRMAPLCLPLRVGQQMVLEKKRSWCLTEQFCAIGSHMLSHVTSGGWAAAALQVADVASCDAIHHDLKHFPKIGGPRNSNTFLKELDLLHDNSQEQQSPGWWVGWVGDSASTSAPTYLCGMTAVRYGISGNVCCGCSDETF